MHARKPQFFILLLLVSFGSVGAVLFTPALPAIQAFFKVSVGQAQMTITTYLIGYAIGQLPYGPLANGIGRKKTLYIGLSLAIFGSLLCAFSSIIGSFGVLVFARFLQALGACVGLKMSFTMIADSYDQTESTRMISRLVLAFAIMPSIAVAAGGWLTQLFNWESCFYFLALFGAFIFWLSTHLPETAPSIDRNALTVSSVIAGYHLKLKNQRLILSSLMMGCLTSAVYVFASKAPFIAIHLIGLSPERFGTYNLIPPIGMIIGSRLAPWLTGRFSFFTVLFGGITGALLSTLTMLILFATSAPQIGTLFYPMVLIYLFQSTVYPHLSAYGLSSAKNKSNASAVLNFINIGTAVVAVFLCELILPESALLLPLSFMFFSCVMLVLWARLKKIGQPV